MMAPFTTSMLAVDRPSNPACANKGLGNTTPLLFPMVRIAISIDHSVATMLFPRTSAVKHSDGQNHLSFSGFSPDPLKHGTNALSLALVGVEC
jgi:hypothetical protein